MHVFQFTLGITISTILTGCGGNSEAEQPTVGFCGESVQIGPTIEISSATDSQSFAPITDVVLSDLALNGMPMTTAVAVHPDSTGVELAGDTLLCKIPCTFGLLEGDYTMAASAPGHRMSRVSITAKHTKVTGDCVKTYSGTTPLAISLEPI